MLATTATTKTYLESSEGDVGNDNMKKTTAATTSTTMIITTTAYLESPERGVGGGIGVEVSIECLQIRKRLRTFQLPEYHQFINWNN